VKTLPLSFLCFQSSWLGLLLCSLLIGSPRSRYREIRAGPYCSCTCFHQFSEVVWSRLYLRGIAGRYELHGLECWTSANAYLSVYLYLLHRCVNILAPMYLSELCVTPAETVEALSPPFFLRTSFSNQLTVLTVKSSTNDARVFVSGSSVWNKLQDYLRKSALPIDILNVIWKLCCLLNTNRTLTAQKTSALHRFNGELNCIRLHVWQRTFPSDIFTKCESTETVSVVSERQI